MSESFADFYQSHSALINEIFIKATSGDDALVEGNLLFLLTEGELDQADVEALRSSTSKLKEYLANVMGVEALSAKLPSAAAWYKAQGRNVQAAEKFVMKLDMNKPKAAKDWVKSVFGKGFTVANGVACVALIDTMAAGGLNALGEATALIQRNLDGKLADETKLIDVPAETGLTKEDIAAAIKKAFDKSMGNEDLKDSQGFMKKIGGKAAKIKGVELSEFPLDNVMPEIMELTLPELSSLVEALSAVPTPDDGAVDDAMDNADAKDGASPEADVEISDDLIGKASQAWLEKLKADGADAALLKLGQQWMAAVSKDAKFKKIAGLTESYRTNLSFLLLEQVMWDDMLGVFGANLPKELKGLSPKQIEPFIAPFAQALADQGIDVVDKAGNPYKPPVGNTDDVIEDIEEDGPTEIAPPELTGLVQKLSKLKGIVNPEKAAVKIADIFGIGGGEAAAEAVVEEGHRWSLYDLLAEEVVKYPDVVKALANHLPKEEAEIVQVVSGIHDIISKDFGKEFGVADLPEVEEKITKDELKAELPRPEGVDDAIIDYIVAVIERLPEFSPGVQINLAESLLNEVAVDDADLRQAIFQVVKKSGPEKDAVEAYFGNEEVKKYFKDKFDLDWGMQAKDVNVEPEQIYKVSAWTGKSPEYVKVIEKGEGENEGKWIVVGRNKKGSGWNELKKNSPKIWYVKEEGDRSSAHMYGDPVDESEALPNADQPAEEGVITVDKIYEYENSKGEKIFVKVTEENPKEGWWQAVKIGKDGKSWDKPTQAFAAKEAGFGEEVDEETAFSGGAGQKIKTADFNSKIAAAIDDTYGDDEELLDLISKDRHDEKVPGVLAKVSQELFGDDFALEESLFRRKLLPFLFEGSYTWADVQKSIDKNAEDVPVDLLYTIFAKAVPAFQELGVEVSGVPEPDLDALKAVLSGEEIDPNAELDIEDPAGISDEEQEKLDAEAQKTAGGLGKTPIDKNKLAAILKKHPDIVGQGQKSTRARRKLRKAINMAAGMEVFAEQFDYGLYSEEKYILDESIESVSIERWKKLAGIKE